MVVTDQHQHTTCSESSSRSKESSSMKSRCMLLAVLFLSISGSVSVSAFRHSSVLRTPVGTRIAEPMTAIKSTTKAARPITSALSVSLEDNWDEIASAVTSPDDNALHLDLILANLALGLQWEEILSASWLETLAHALQQLVQLYLQLPVVQQVGTVVIPGLTVVTAWLYQLSHPPADYRTGMEPYPRGTYDPIQARNYYRQHPLLVTQRVLQALRLSNQFIIGLLLDKYVLKREEKMRPQRAQELLELITKLGPTAIKVGQALSVRPDIVPEEFTEALATLQDQVPPFEGQEAKRILKEQLGTAKFEKLQELGLFTKGPVASASIGQVYKAKLNGRDVAVKVQRPNVLSDIALDLFIVREFAPYYQRLTQTSSDLQALANEWGRGFIAELDYRKEAADATQFSKEMRKRGLNAVCAPTVIQDGFSQEQVLVTEWVEGTRIDQSDAGDVPRLCSVALNAYLVMLLETQVLHCDPHPGNLLRTPDGRLCILDWGMTLDVDPNLQYSLLEFVAHLTSDNYDDLPQDLAKLGFLKEEKLEFAERSGILEPFKYFLKQLGQGGGADGIRDRILAEYREKYPGRSDDELRLEMRSEMMEKMEEIIENESIATGITMEVEELQRQNRESFEIPEWFLYTSRAFLTLEGVSLSADESYSIIASCFPYVAKRLVADDDPRARKALRDLIYGKNTTVDVDRLSDLADGFSSYTTTTKTVNANGAAAAARPELNGAALPANGVRPTFRVNGAANKNGENRKEKLEAVITLAKDSADILLARKGNLVQSLLIEESAWAASADVKDLLKASLVDAPKQLRSALPFGFLLPPLFVERQLDPFVQKNPQERAAQRLAQKLQGLANGATTPNHGATSAPNGVTSGFDKNGAALAEKHGKSSTNAAFALIDLLRQLEPEQAALVLKELRQNLPKYGPLVGLLGVKFVATLLRTASGNIESTLQELEEAGQRPDEFVRVTAKGLSSIAERGATVVMKPDHDEEEGAP